MLEVLGMADEALSKLLTCGEAGRLGGLTTARRRTPEQRREIARRAAQTRWQKKAGAPDPTPPTDPRGPQHRDLQAAEAGILSSRRRPAASICANESEPRSRAFAA